MARRKTEELHKHTLNLRAGDMEKIASLFPQQSASYIIRRLISKFVDKTSAVENHLPEEPIDL